MERLLRTIIVPLLAVAVGVLVGMLFLWATGYPAIATFRNIVRESLPFESSVPGVRNWYGFGQVLRSATLLTFTGLAVAVAFHAGLFNIGVEGQLYIGAVVLGIAGYYLKQVPKESISGIHWSLYLLGAVGLSMLCSGLWAAIPGVLKAVTGAHEVISTIMMNFVAYSLVNYLLRPGGTFAQAGRMQTPAMPRTLRVPRLQEMFPVFEGATLNHASWLAVIAAVAIWAMLRFTRFGFALRAVGKNPDAARAAGISPGRIIVLSMFLSGALSGLVGVEFVLGHKGYFEEGFSAGLGFLGIAVALLANNHPIGLLFTALLFGVLNYGKVAAAGDVPKDIIEIMQAAIILSVILGNKAFAMWLVRLKKQRVAAEANAAEAVIS
ncbi:MAG: ABC transporter permease [Candidatus Sumerlaeaceae bacterium]